MRDSPFLVFATPSSPDGRGYKRITAYQPLPIDMEKIMNEWNRLEETLKEEIEDRKQEFEEHSYPDDLLHEIIDFFVPIYYQQLLDVARDNMSICYPEDEGLYSNDMDIFKRLQTGIYEQLTPIAYEAYEDITVKEE